MASFGVGSVRGLSMNDGNSADRDSMVAAWIIILSIASGLGIAGALLFAAGFVIGKIF